MFHRIVLNQLLTLKINKMKKLITFAILFCIAITSLFAQTKAGKRDTIKLTTYYTCSQHPEVVSDKDGKCPQCGMALKLSAKEQMKTKVVKNYVCPVHLDIVSHDPGKCPQCGKKLNLSSKEQMKAKVMKTYTCPMHPEVALTKDGVCPKCGKELVEKKKD